MNKKNFTLLELSVVLLVIVALASFMVSGGISIAEETTSKTVENRLLSIEAAISGNDDIRDYDGSLVANGYLNDMGSLPTSLDDLFEQGIQPDYSYSNLEVTINSATVNLGVMGAGWKGPYSPLEKFSERMKELIDFDNTQDLDTPADGINDLLISSTWIPSTETARINNIEIKSTDILTSRAVSISGISQSDLSATSPCTIYIWYPQNGTVQNRTIVLDDPSDSLTQVITALPSGTIALFAVYEATVSGSSTDVIVVSANPTPSPPTTNGNEYLVAPSGTSGNFTAQRYNITGNNLNVVTVSDGDTVRNSSSGVYYQYSSGTSTWSQLSAGVLQSELIKTVKSDIAIKLE